jgi:hypothetical protein
MSELARLQRTFLAALRGEGDGELAPHLIAGSHVQACLCVYRDGMGAAWHDELADTYPVVRRLVGPDFFREMAGRYGRSHPSTSGDLHGYGDRLAEFLEGYPFARGLPYLPDVARLEWACHECFHAADGRALDVAALARVPQASQGGLRLGLRPWVRLAASPHPLLALWEANQPGRDGAPDELRGAERILVARADFVVRPSPIGEGQWVFLEALAQGQTLQQAVTRLRRRGLHETFGELLMACASAGLLAGPTGFSGEGER